MSIYLVFTKVGFDYTEDIRLKVFYKPLNSNTFKVLKNIITKQDVLVYVKDLTDGIPLYIPELASKLLLRADEENSLFCLRDLEIDIPC